MSDVIYVAVVVAFFAVAVAYVRGCARIVGDDDVVRVDADDTDDAAGAADGPGVPESEAEEVRAP